MSNDVTSPNHSIAKFNAAVEALTVNANRSSSRDKDSAIQFLGRRVGNPDIAKVLGDVLRRFSSHLSSSQKIEIAAVLSANSELPPMTKRSLADSIEIAISRETDQGVVHVWREMRESFEDPGTEKS